MWPSCTTARKLVPFSGIIFSLFTLIAAASSLAQSNSPSPKPSPSASPSATPAFEEWREGFLPDTPLSVTEHTISIGGKPIKYKVTTGYVTLRQDEADQQKDEFTSSPADSDSGSTAAAAAAAKSAAEAGEKKRMYPPDHPEYAALNTKARMFFVAYTREGISDPASRPITFAFSGGPGYASVFPNIGGFGPRRLQLSDKGEPPSPPYKLVDNNNTWLDDSDLVFIDEISSGYSRAAYKEDAKQFYGYKFDVATFAEFIREFLTSSNRWSSPMFLYGEAYGTTRASGLARYLRVHDGINLNGLILASTFLNISSYDFHPGNNLPCIGALPTYTATAWFHKKLSPDLQNKNLSELLPEVETFANTDYAIALSKGDDLIDPQRKDIIGKLSWYTGLSPEFISVRNLRFTDKEFLNEILKSERRAPYELDTRLEQILLDPDDYKLSLIFQQAFTSTFIDYLRRELNYDNKLHYYTKADVSPWDYTNIAAGFGISILDTTDDLREAMSENPYMKVWITSGYYDLATPYFSSDKVLWSLFLDPKVKNNLHVSKYESGHLPYLDSAVLGKMKSDFHQFVIDAVKPRAISLVGQ